MALEKAEQYGRAIPEEMAAGPVSGTGPSAGGAIPQGGRGSGGGPQESASPGPGCRTAGHQRGLFAEYRPAPGKCGGPPPGPGPGRTASGGRRPQKHGSASRRNWSSSCNNLSRCAATPCSNSRPVCRRRWGRCSVNMEAQYGQKVNLDVERLPQFQEEWLRFMGQLQDQIEPVMATSRRRCAWPEKFAVKLIKERGPRGAPFLWSV